MWRRPHIFREAMEHLNAMSERSIGMKKIVFIVTIGWLSFSALAETHPFKPEPGSGVHSYRVRPPVLRIKPGDRVVTETLYGGYYDPERAGAWPGEVGPIYIEGATPNDTLVVKIVRLRINREYAISPHFPHFGTLFADRWTPMLNPPVPPRRFVWRLNREANTGTLLLPGSRMQQVVVPLRPMMGRLAVAPIADTAFDGLWPGDFGGNMDSPDAQEGTTVYLPIFHEGAYFYFGDGHALQGDGEIVGTGLETTMEVTFDFDLIRGRPINWPRFENDEYIMVAGSVRPLIDALRIAYVELINWMVQDYGFDRWEAAQLASQLGVTRVANAVDPQYTVMAKFPKKYLERE